MVMHGTDDDDDDGDGCGDDDVKRNKAREINETGRGGARLDVAINGFTMQNCNLHKSKL